MIFIKLNLRLEKAVELITPEYERLKKCFVVILETYFDKHKRVVLHYYAKSVCNKHHELKGKEPCSMLTILFLMPFKAVLWI